MKAPKRPRRKGVRIPRRQWDLAAGMHRGSGTLATLRQVVDPKVRTVSFRALSKRRQAEIVADRISNQRTFRLWILGGLPARIGRGRAIEEVRARTPVGEALIQVEDILIATMAREAARRRKASP